MEFHNTYLQEIVEKVKEKNAHEPEFIQTVEEVLKSLEPVIDKHPEYVEANLIGRMVEPERQFMFRVPWVDDKGKIQVNRGFRVQFNGSLGPYKGGLRFHPTVYLGMIKFLGFEQTFKNSLTGLPIGGAKGGSDFDPHGKSDGEIMRFCQSFMTELSKYIGPDLDVPAGDIGVGGREIGFLYGQYKRIKSSFENGVLTGKGLSYGGSLIRPEATGYGAVYYTREMLADFDEKIAGKTFVLSGYGNVTWGAADKIKELGGKVVTISGSKGYVHIPEGLSQEQIDFLLRMRGEGISLEEFANKFDAAYYPGEKPWKVKGDVVMPCATQNEVTLEEAKQIVANGSKFYVEVSNMPTTNEAIAYLQKEKVQIAPSKAANAGGVACSALEMSQNSMRLSWTREEVDAKLDQIMVDIYNHSKEAAEEEGLGYNLVAGANIAGFKKVADAMMAHGVI